jgi:hypothetical protein
MAPANAGVLAALPPCIAILLSQSPSDVVGDLRRRPARGVDRDRGDLGVQPGGVLPARYVLAPL